MTKKKCKNKITDPVNEIVERLLSIYEETSQIIFDMDDTLVSTDKDADIASLYLNIDHQKWKPLAMKVFQHFNVERRPYVHILTNRHPILLDEISKKFKMGNWTDKNVTCRDYCLSTLGIKEVLQHPEKEQNYLKRMIQEKTNFLNRQIRTNIYIDDRAKDFDLYLLNPNVSLFDAEFNFIGTGRKGVCWDVTLWPSKKMEELV